MTSDNDIIQQILSGDIEKYRLLVEKYQQMVFRTCIGFVHNKDDADDLTQEVFIQAYESLSRFRGESSFSTWLYRISVNASLNRTRKSPLKRIMDMIDDRHENKAGESIINMLPDGEDPEQILIREEDIARVRKALDTLPENQKTAVVLSRYDGLPQKEIAEIMNTTEGAVEALLQRAKKRLQEKLSSPVKKNKKLP